MNITLISNGYDPHMSPLCESFAQQSQTTFSFIACTSPNEIACSAIANKKASIEPSPSFVYPAWVNEAAWKNAKKIVEKSDVIIFGSGDQRLLPELMGDRLFFIYSERPFKKNNLLFLRRLKLHFNLRKTSAIATGCLCASAFSKEDFSSARLFNHKFLRWGYFPNGNLSVDLSSKKIGNSGFLHLYWSGRMLDWKRPKLALAFAARLKALNIPFHLEMAGEGPLKPELENEANRRGIKDDVSFLGFLTNQNNLERMKFSDVVLFTSNRKEGWGATVNEALSSKTVVVCSSEVGSAPFLLKDHSNGYTFFSEEDLLNIAALLTDNQKNNELASAGRNTIENQWNGQIAAHNLLQQIMSIKNKGVFDYTICPSEPASVIF